MKQGLVWYLIVMLGLMPVLTSCSPSAPTSKEYIPHPFGRPVSDPSSSSSASVLPRLVATEKKVRIQAKLLEIATKNTLPVDKRILRLQVFIPTEERLQSFSAQALPLQEITQVKASVSGIAIDAPIKPTGADANGFVPVPAEGVVILDFIVPVGPRIVTVEGYTSQGQLIGGSTLKAAFDVREVKAAPSALDFETTAAALVMEELLGVDALFASRVDPLKLQEFVRNFQQLAGLPHPLFLNPNGLAKILFDSNLNTYPGAPVKIPNLGAVPLSYQQDFHPGSVTIFVTTSNGNQFPEDVTVQIEDPVSEIAVIPKGTAAPASVMIPNLYPGLWLITVRKVDGTLVGFNNLMQVHPNGTVSGLQQGTSTNPIIFSFFDPPPNFTDIQLAVRDFMLAFNQNAQGFQLVPTDQALDKLIRELFRQSAISASNSHETVMNAASQFIQSQGILDGIANLTGAYLALKLITEDTMVMSANGTHSMISPEIVETVSRGYLAFFNSFNGKPSTDFTTKIALNDQDTSIKIMLRNPFTIQMESAPTNSGKSSSTVSVPLNLLDKKPQFDEELGFHRWAEPDLAFRILATTVNTIAAADTFPEPGANFYYFRPPPPADPINGTFPQPNPAPVSYKVKTTAGDSIMLNGGYLVVESPPDTTKAPGSAEQFEAIVPSRSVAPSLMIYPPVIDVTSYISSGVRFGIMPQSSNSLFPPVAMSDLVLEYSDTPPGPVPPTIECLDQIQRAHILNWVSSFVVGTGVALGFYKFVIPLAKYGFSFWDQFIIRFTVSIPAGSTYRKVVGPRVFVSAKCQQFITEQLIQPAVETLTVDRQSIPPNHLIPIAFSYLNAYNAPLGLVFQIVNDSGQKVKTLKTLTVQPGDIYHETLGWDLKDETGTPLPPGTYEALIATTLKSDAATVVKIQIH